MIRTTLAILALSTLVPSSLYSFQLPPNVILITLDGVRWQEVFHGQDPEVDPKSSHEIIFKNLHQSLARRGILSGDRLAGADVKISNPVAISLPGYQSIAAGFPQPCLTNECGQITTETMQERILRELNLVPSQVVSIASWEPIRYAVEQHPGGTFVNTGVSPLVDSIADKELMYLNSIQSKDAPNWGTRYDKYTYAQALRYLRRHHPRFLYISLGDADEWAHEGNYPKYVEILRQYDQWIAELVQFIDETPEYRGNTTLLVTTDHGRGNGKNWTTHGTGPEALGSDSVWLFGISPYTDREKKSFTQPIATRNYSHSDIRPTLEANLGLKPLSCPSCGRVIESLIHP